MKFETIQVMCNLFLSTYFLNAPLAYYRSNNTFPRFRLILLLKIKENHHKKHLKQSLATLIFCFYLQSMLSRLVWNQVWFAINVWALIQDVDCMILIGGGTYHNPKSQTIWSLLWLAPGCTLFWFASITAKRQQLILKLYMCEKRDLLNWSLTMNRSA